MHFAVGSALLSFHSHECSFFNQDLKTDNSKVHHNKRLQKHFKGTVAVIRLHFKGW